MYSSQQQRVHMCKCLHFCIFTSPLDTEMIQEFQEKLSSTKPAGWDQAITLQARWWGTHYSLLESVEPFLLTLLNGKLRVENKCKEAETFLLTNHNIICSKVCVCCWSRSKFQTILAEKYAIVFFWDLKYQRAVCIAFKSWLLGPLTDAEDTQ